MNLDLSKAAGPYCIPVVVLKNCDPEVSLGVLFSISFHQWSLYFRMLGERSTTKNYDSLILLSVVGKKI